MSVIRFEGFLLLVLAVFATQQVLALTQSDKNALKWIENQYNFMMTEEISTLFRILKGCTSEPDAVIQKCIAKALVETESRRHEDRLTFIFHYFSRVEYTCLKLKQIFYKNKTLFRDEEKVVDFSQKMKEFLQDLKVCRLTDGDTNLAVKVRRAKLEEYAKRTN